jgi:hypothetical protein
MFLDSTSKQPILTAEADCSMKKCITRYPFIETRRALERHIEKNLRQ